MIWFVGFAKCGSRSEWERTAAATVEGSSLQHRSLEGNWVELGRLCIIALHCVAGGKHLGGGQSWSRSSCLALSRCLKDDVRYLAWVYLPCDVGPEVAVDISDPYRFEHALPGPTPIVVEDMFRLVGCYCLLFACATVCCVLFVCFVLVNKYMYVMYSVCK